MLINKGSEITYLENYRNGKIKAGLGIGNNLDNYLRLKHGQLNILLGHDNVGKTFFFTYYMLSHAIINNKTFSFSKFFKRAYSLYKCSCIFF